MGSWKIGLIQAAIIFLCLISIYWSIQDWRGKGEGEPDPTIKYLGIPLGLAGLLSTILWILK